MYYSLSPSSPIEICEAINHVDKKNKKRNIENRKRKQEIKSQPTTPSGIESINMPTKTSRKPMYLCTLKGDHLLKDCHGMFQVL